MDEALVPSTQRRKRSGSDTSITPPTDTITPKPTVTVSPRLTAAAKGKQTTKSLSTPSEPGGSGTDEGTGSKPGVLDVPTDELEEELSWNSFDDEGEEDADEDKNGDERDDDEENQETANKDEGDGEEDQESSSVSSQFVTSMLNPTSDVGMESIFVTASSSVAPLHTSTPIMTPSTISTITTISQAPIPPTPILSEVLQNLPTFASVFRFDERLKSLEAKFSEYRQTNPFAEAVSDISGIFHQYMNQQMNEAEQVKGQVKEQVSKILPRIEQSVNGQLEAEVLTRSSYSSRTSYAVAADLSKMELKKILIKKLEGNKSIQCLDEQRNLYKALDEGPSVGSDRGSKRRKEGKEPESASAPLETATKSAGRYTTGSKHRQASASESAFVEEPVHTTSQIEEPSHPPKKPPTPYRDWNKTLPAVQGSTQTWISELAKQADSRSSFNELLDTPLDFFNFIMNRLRVETLTPELLVGPTFELMKGSYNQGRRVIPFAHFINNDLEYLRGEVLLLAWDRVFKIKDALGNKQYKPKDTQKLFRKLFNDVQNIHEELAEYINTSGWNRPAFYNNGDDDDEDCTITITSNFLITDSLSMEDEHLDTIPTKESDEFNKSSVEDLVLNLSEFEDECECDVPIVMIFKR
nr:hypothetical protein [Tanacetum cinerariifolium]